MDKIREIQLIVDKKTMSTQNEKKLNHLFITILTFFSVTSSSFSIEDIFSVKENLDSFRRKKEDIWDEVKSHLEQLSFTENNIDSAVPYPYIAIPVFNDRHITMQYLAKGEPINTLIIGKWFDVYIGKKHLSQEKNKGPGYCGVIVREPSGIVRFGHVSDKRTNDYPKYNPGINNMKQIHHFNSFLKSKGFNKSFDFRLNENILKTEKNRDRLIEFEKLFKEYFEVDTSNIDYTAPVIPYSSENVPLPVSFDFDGTIHHFNKDAEGSRSKDIKLTKLGNSLLKLFEQKVYFPWFINTARSETCSFTGMHLEAEVRKLLTNESQKSFIGVKNPRNVLPSSLQKTLNKVRYCNEMNSFLHYDDKDTGVSASNVCIVEVSEEDMNTTNRLPHSNTSTNYNPIKANVVKIGIIGCVGSGKSTLAEEMIQYYNQKDENIHVMHLGNDSSTVCQPDLAIRMANTYSIHHNGQKVVLLFDQCMEDGKGIELFDKVFYVKTGNSQFNIASILNRHNHDNLNGINSDTKKYNDDDFEFKWAESRHEWDLSRLDIIDVLNKFEIDFGSSGLDLFVSFLTLNQQQVTKRENSNLLYISYAEGRPGSRRTAQRCFHNLRKLLICRDEPGKAFVVSRGPPLTCEVSIEPGMNTFDNIQGSDNNEMNFRVHPKIREIINIVIGKSKFTPIKAYAKADGSTLKCVVISPYVYNFLMKGDSLTSVDRKLLEASYEETNGKYAILTTSSGSTGLGAIVSKFLMVIHEMAGNSTEIILEKASQCNNQQEKSKLMNEITDVITNFWIHKMISTIESQSFSIGTTICFELETFGNKNLFGEIDKGLVCHSLQNRLVLLGYVTSSGWFPSTPEMGIETGFIIPTTYILDSVEQINKFFKLTKLFAEGKISERDFNDELSSYSSQYVPKGLVESGLSPEGWMFEKNGYLVKGKPSIYFPLHKPGNPYNINRISGLYSENKDNLSVMIRLKEMYPTFNNFVETNETFQHLTNEFLVDKVQEYININAKTIFCNDKSTNRKDTVLQKIQECEYERAIQMLGNFHPNKFMLELLQCKSYMNEVTWRELSTSRNSTHRQIVNNIMKAIYNVNNKSLCTYLFCVTCLH